MSLGTEKTLGVQKMTENGRRSCSMHDSVGIMADRLDFERLRGFCDGWTDRQTDICDSRVAFATEKVSFYCTLHFLVQNKFKSQIFVYHVANFWTFLCSIGHLSECHNNPIIVIKVISWLVATDIIYSIFPLNVNLLWNLYVPDISKTFNIPGICF